MTSFMSEHTVELQLVPRFQAVLGPGFSKAIPFFFWSTREGNSESKSRNVDQSIRLCALFPRRPKLGGGSSTFMKVNEEVFAMAFALRRLGIPSFAGIPLVSSIFEFTGEFNCQWFFLTPTDNFHFDLEIECETHKVVSNKHIAGPCRDKDICEIVKSSAMVMSWPQAMEAVRSVRNISHQNFRYRFPFGPTYKPVYFALC
jgi:hypothetical protein